MAIRTHPGKQVLKTLFGEGFSILHSSCSGGNMDSSLLSNIQKLFYERIEVFAAVEFNKLSIVTGIIKIALKVGAYVIDIQKGPDSALSSTGIARPLLNVSD